METENANAQEIWEATTDSTHWVLVKDPRESGGWKKKKVGGRGTKKITLTVEEREFNQELVDEEYTQHDPFSNGMLVRIHPADAERGDNEMTDEQLVEALKVEGDDIFTEYLQNITSEVILRRLLKLAERNTTVYRYDEIVDHVNAKFRIGKTSKVVKEIFEDDQKYAAADL